MIQHFINIPRLIRPLINNFASLLSGVVSVYKAIVLEDQGTVESEICLNNNVTYLISEEDSAYTDYSTRVFNEIGMVEPSESETFDNTLASILAIDTPSVLLIPNGRREGKLYSALPTSGSGDFTFTGIDANGGRTRVNKAGQIEVVRRNLLAYSSTQSVWAPTTGFTRTNATIRGNAASNLVVTATQNGVEYLMGLRNDTSFSLSLLSGSTYTFSFRVKPLDGNGNFAYYFVFQNGAAANRHIGATFNVITGATSSTYTEACTKVGRSITPEGNGVYLVSETFTMTESLVTCLSLALGFGNGLSSQVIGRNADFGTPQLELGSFPTIYQEANNGISQPRIDYSSGNAAFLGEPTRTNLWISSNAFSLSYVALYGGTLTSEALASIIQNYNWVSYTESSASNVQGLYEGISVTSGSVYTLSVYAKQKSGSRHLRLSFGANFASSFAATLDLSTGVANINTAGGVTGKVTNMGNGIYRLEVTQTANGTGNSNITISLAQTSGGSPSYTGDGTSGIYIIGAQFEVGNYASSLIITETASKTRTNDLLSGNTPLTQNKGTIIIEIGPYIIGTGLNNPHLKIGDFEVRANDANNWNFYYDNANLGGWTASKTARVKFAFSFNGSQVKAFRNGTLLASPTNRTSTALIATTVFNPGSSAFGMPLEKLIISGVQYSDAQCIALTT